MSARDQRNRVSHQEERLPTVSIAQRPRLHNPRVPATISDRRRDGVNEEEFLLDRMDIDSPPESPTKKHTAQPASLQLQDITSSFETDLYALPLA